MIENLYVDFRLSTISCDVSTQNSILDLKKLANTIEIYTTMYSRLLIDAVIGRDSSYLFLRVGISTFGYYQTQLKITITMGKNYCAIKDCHNTAVYR